MSFEILNLGGCPVQLWTPANHPLEAEARLQLGEVSRLPFVKRLSVMPDAHLGQGSTIGSVIATEGVVIPAAVGLDGGCGMDYLELSIFADQVPTNRDRIFEAIGRAVPHGRTNQGGEGDRGAWGQAPKSVADVWREKLSERYEALLKQVPELIHHRALRQLGTLGTGNHFVEITHDETGRVGIMLHSGSRGVGARITNIFIRKAKAHMKQLQKQRSGVYAGIAADRLPKDTPIPPYYPVENAALAYLTESRKGDFADYMEAIAWVQDYAQENRALMMRHILVALHALTEQGHFPKWEVGDLSISCHHNYIAREDHEGRGLWVTRKGAIRAEEGDMGIIPGSMGAESFLVRGKGNPEALNSAAHGAGRVMSRKYAKAHLRVEDLVKDTKGVTCDKTEGQLDEAPRNYKNVREVMDAQKDMVEIVHTLGKPLVCVKGKGERKEKGKKR
jgi:tRNA-splicing ligase RtcB